MTIAVNGLASDGVHPFGPPQQSRSKIAEDTLVDGDLQEPEETVQLARFFPWLHTLCTIFLPISWWKRWLWMVLGATWYITVALEATYHDTVENKVYFIQQAFAFPFQAVDTGSLFYFMPHVWHFDFEVVWKFAGFSKHGMHMSRYEKCALSDTMYAANVYLCALLVVAGVTMLATGAYMLQFAFAGVYSAYLGLVVAFVSVTPGMLSLAVSFVYITALAVTGERAAPKILEQGVEELVHWHCKFGELVTHSNKGLLTVINIQVLYGIYGCTYAFHGFFRGMFDALR